MTTEAQPYYIAVVSDLHCHPASEKPQETYLYSDALARPITQHPVWSLVDLIKRERLRADAIVTPGDLANRASVAGFIAAWRYIHDIKASLGATVLAATIGNHDVESRRADPPARVDPFQLARDCFLDFPVQDPGLQSSFWSKRYFIVETTTSRLLVINSVSQHFTELEAKRGAFTSADMDNLDAELTGLVSKPYQIAVLHHHPLAHDIIGLGSDDLMVNGDALMQILEKRGYRLVIHGHKHHPRLRYASGGSTSPVVFASGSLSAVSNWGITSNTRNLFHLIRLDPSITGAPIPNGVIQSWEFNWGIGWNKPNWQSASFPECTGFGCRNMANQLADATLTELDRQGVEFLPWTQMLDKCPVLRYLTPDDFLEYSRTLRSRHGLELMPQAPDLPRLVGRLANG